MYLIIVTSNRKYITIFHRISNTKIQLMLEIDLRKNRKKQRFRDVNRKIEYQCHGVKDNKCSDVITEFLLLLLYRLFCLCMYSIL